VRGHLKNRAKLVDAVRIGAADLLALEKEKIHDAIKTDSILSAEIVVIANAAMLTAPLLTKALALSAVSIFVTIAIYGTVAMIVKADDIGLHLSRREGSGWRIDTQRAVGRFLLQAMPPFLKAISVVGTLAMLMVGGGILVHHVHLPTVAPLVKLILTTLLGMSAGLACIAVVSIAKLIYSRATAMRPPQE
jgi:predicted DNA repair protein MutK